MKTNNRHNRYKCSVLHSVEDRGLVPGLREAGVREDELRRALRDLGGPGVEALHVRDVVEDHDRLAAVQTDRLDAVGHRLHLEAGQLQGEVVEAVQIYVGPIVTVALVLLQTVQAAENLTTLSAAVL